MNLSTASLLYFCSSKDFSIKDYYPFGMVMPERNYSSDSYNFGFNSKLKDDEFMGSGNSYDFGERWYEPRIGKWLSVDPLSTKYPNLSPYHFCASNPILYRDEDGRDYEIYINHTTKTIILKATYYYPQNDLQAQNLATHSIIAISRQVKDKYLYQVLQSNGSTIDYKIEFQLETKPTDNLDASFSYGDAYKGGGQVDIKAIQTDQSYANKFQVLPDNVVKADQMAADPTAKPTDIIYGVTVGSNQVEMSDIYAGVENSIHEIVHTWGVKHMAYGLMQTLDDAAKSRFNRLNEITPSVIGQLLFNVGLGNQPLERDGGETANERIKTERGRHSIKKEIGTRPSNFDSGKVITK